MERQRCGAPLDFAAARTSVSVTRPSGPVPLTVRKIDALFGRNASREWRSLHSRFPSLPLRSAASRRRGFLLSRFRPSCSPAAAPSRLLFLGGRRLLRLGLRFLFWRSFLFFFRFRLRLLSSFFGFGRSCFAFAADERDLVAHVHLAAFLDVNFRERSVLGRFPFHRRLVGLDFGDDVTRRTLSPFFFFHATSVPSVIVSLSFGIWISGMAISR